MGEEIYLHVTATGKGRTREVKCNYCFDVFTSHNKDRWKQHIRTCESATASVRALFPVKSKQKPVTTPSETEHPPSTLLSSIILPSLNQPTVIPWVDTMREEEQIELDESFASIFYSNGIPFRCAEAPATKAFLTKLRPSYNIPSAWRICNTLLNNAYNKFEIRRTLFINDCN